MQNPLFNSISLSTSNSGIIGKVAQFLTSRSILEQTVFFNAFLGQKKSNSTIGKLLDISPFQVALIKTKLEHALKGFLEEGYQEFKNWLSEVEAGKHSWIHGLVHDHQGNEYQAEYCTNCDYLVVAYPPLPTQSEHYPEDMVILVKQEDITSKDADALTLKYKVDCK